MMDELEPAFSKFVVGGVDMIAERIASIRLEPVDGGTVAAWQPGAHIDVRVDGNMTRQYSLCGDQTDTRAYTIGVLLEPAGRGGSIAMHRLQAGDLLEVRGPRNNFELVPAPRYIFFAGGIGITPIVSMIRSAGEQGIPWRLVYGARSSAAFAYGAELQSVAGGTVALVPQDTGGHIRLDQELSDLEPDAVVYACGPPSMLDAVNAACAAAGFEGRLHIERFAASGLVTPNESGDQPIEVELARTGVTVLVQPGQSIVEAVLPVRPDLPYSCLDGYCGTCETRVLDGIPDHRDEYLTEDERLNGDSMMLCVSRARSERLVLDL